MRYRHDNNKKKKIEQKTKNLEGVHIPIASLEPKFSLHFT